MVSFVCVQHFKKLRLALPQRVVVVNAVGLGIVLCYAAQTSLCGTETMDCEHSRRLVKVTA